jgi:hypothetical protein
LSCLVSSRLVSSRLVLSCLVLSCLIWLDVKRHDAMEMTIEKQKRKGHVTAAEQTGKDVAVRTKENLNDLQLGNVVFPPYLSKKTWCDMYETRHDKKVVRRDQDHHKTCQDHDKAMCDTKRNKNNHTTMTMYDKTRKPQNEARQRQMARTRQHMKSRRERERTVVPTLRCA